LVGSYKRLLVLVPEPIVHADKMTDVIASMTTVLIYLMPSQKLVAWDGGARKRKECNWPFEVGEMKGASASFPTLICQRLWTTRDS
jgi:hypothetical protein